MLRGKGVIIRTYATGCVNTLPVRVLRYALKKVGVVNGDDATHVHDATVATVHQVPPRAVIIAVLGAAVYGIMSRREGRTKKNRGGHQSCNTYHRLGDGYGV